MSWLRKPKPKPEPNRILKIDKDGIPLLDEVVDEPEEKEPRAWNDDDTAPPADIPKGEQDEIARLAESVASELAEKLSGALEAKLVERLRPMLERRLREMQQQSAGQAPQGTDAGAPATATAESKDGDKVAEGDKPDAVSSDASGRKESNSSPAEEKDAGEDKP